MENKKKKKNHNSITDIHKDTEKKKKFILRHVKTRTEKEKRKIEHKSHLKRQV